jgi:uncharacterized membrane protein YjjP (DUF1212 family)
MTDAGLAREELSELVDLLLNIGQAMLESGAGSFRTEETMATIGLGLGADRLEMWVTPTGMVVTAFSAEEQHTRVGRVGSIGVNMAQIWAVDQLSRRVAFQGGTFQSVRAELEAIKATPRELPNWVVIATVGLACGAFCKNLGGGWPEFAAATVGAGAAQWLKLILRRLGVNFLMVTVVCAMAASLVAWLIAQIIPGDTMTLGLIASVLLLVPGVVSITTIIDLTNYDLVSGVVRGVLALIIVLSIGVGMMLTLWVTGMRILP